MINISWDSTAKKWNHHEAHQQITWGALNAPLPYSSVSKGTVIELNQIHREHIKAGPLIGIVTSKRSGLPFVGNIQTFQRLSKYIFTQGAFPFIFTPHYKKDFMVPGYFYDSILKQWEKALFPVPDFVYNRIPYQLDEYNPNYISFFEWLSQHSIPYFNRCFFTKWETYLVLNGNSNLRNFLPETRLATSKSLLQLFLTHHKQIIVKPIANSQGHGIFSLTQNRNGEISLVSNQDRKTYQYLDEVWEDRSFKTNKFLLQPLIDRMRYINRPLDYRVLIQKQRGDWGVTGCGARLAGIGKLTTHIPAGGQMLPIEKVPLNQNLVERIASEIGTSLERAFGPIGEFSFDIGIDQNNQYWLFEVNSKPMVFDEPEIQNNALERLYQQILEVTNMSHTK